MTRALLGLAALALSALLAGRLEGQACVGIPTYGGQTAITGSVRSPEGSRVIGAGIHRDFDSPLSWGVEYELTEFDAEALSDRHTVGTRVAYDVTPLALLLGRRAVFSVCPTASASYSRWEERDFIGATAGAGIGAEIMLLPALHSFLQPFAIPQFMHARVVSEDPADEEARVTETDTTFGMVLGANVFVRHFFLGVSTTRTFREGETPVLGIYGGVTF